VHTYAIYESIAALVFLFGNDLKIILATFIIVPYYCYRKSDLIQFINEYLHNKKQEYFVHDCDDYSAIRLDFD